MKDVYSIDFGKDSWTIEDDTDGYKKYKHNELALYFKIRFNRGDSGMIEFVIFDGDRCLGGDNHFGGTEKSFQKWIGSFLYDKQFVTWISEKKLQVF